jgi:hypothetical protein
MLLGRGSLAMGFSILAKEGENVSSGLIGRQKKKEGTEQSNGELTNKFAIRLEKSTSHLRT